MSDTRHRNALLLHALQTAPPNVKITLPRGCESLARVDFTHADVPLILRLLRDAGGHGAGAANSQVLIDLSGCSPIAAAVPIEEDIFVAGWRDYSARMVRDGTRPRVIVPAPPPPPPVAQTVTEAARAVVSAMKAVSAADVEAAAKKSVSFASVEVAALSKDFDLVDEVPQRVGKVGPHASTAPAAFGIDTFSPSSPGALSIAAAAAGTATAATAAATFDPFAEALESAATAVAASAASATASSPAQSPQSPNAALITKAGTFPEPVTLTCAQFVPKNLFAPLLDDMATFQALVYDCVLLGCHLFLTTEGQRLAAEVLDMMRPALGISASAHSDAIRGLAVPQLAQHVQASPRVADVAAHPAMTLPTEAEPMLRSLEYQRKLLMAKTGGPQFLKRTALVVDAPCAQDSVAGKRAAPFPFLVRALIFAGVLSPLYHDDPTFAVDSEDLADTIATMKRRLVISDEVGHICRVHSILLQHAALHDGGSGQQEQQQQVQDDSDDTAQHLFEQLIAAVAELDDEAAVARSSNGAASSVEALQYRNFVLLRVLDLCAERFVHFDTVQEPAAFLRYCRLFVATCTAGGVAFLDQCFGHVVGSLSAAPSANYVVMFLLSQVLCAPLYRELHDSRDTLTADIALEQLVETVIGTYDGVAPYAKLMAEVVPNAAGLVLPGIVRMLSPALFVHWRAEYESGSGVPLNLLPITQLIYNAVSKLAAPHLANKAVMANVHSAVEDLDWVSALLLRRVTAVGAELEKLFESLMMGVCWYECTLGKAPHSSSLDLFAMFHQLLPPLNACVAPMTNQLMGQYVNSCSRVLNEYINRVAGPLAFGDKIAAWEREVAETGGFIRMHRLCTLKAERLRSFFTQLDLAEAVLRLNTLLDTEQHLHRFVQSICEKHRDLRQLVGGAPLEPGHLLDETLELLERRIGELSEFLAMRVVHHDLRPRLSQLYVIDMKWYKAHKHDKKLLSEDRNGHLIFAHDITIKTVTDAIDHALMNFLPLISEVSVREDIVSHLFAHFAAAYFQIVLEGGDERFFFPEQHEDLFNDVCYVEGFFVAATSQETQNSKKGPWATAVGMLAAIKVVVMMVMSQPTDVLINGSGADGTVLRFADLPEQSSNSPMSKYIVRCVLAHRKDQTAKKFTAANPQPAPRR